ncbi:MAG: alpha/beta fold hydrolase [Alphaproteobacteria bacterium]|nr:MAG: alpha/beta fold hydrolase [Alphaproteobacteria bacterium]
MSLEGPSLPPHSGTADSLVILLHGYGADGNDLIGIGEALAPHLPRTRFMAPNAPQRCANNPMGYQWFPIPWMDGSSETEMIAGFNASVDLLNGYLDAAAREMPPARTVLVGFSQGTMMALHVALRRPDPVAGIVGFSGRLLSPETLAAEIACRPPVLLVHGDQDPMVPYASMAEAAQALAAAGVPVQTHTSPGTGHGIAADGLQVAFGFINAHLKGQ